MLRVTANQADTFKEFVREWLALLSKRDFEQAIKLIDEPNHYGHWWTVEELRKILLFPAGGGFFSTLLNFNILQSKEYINLFEVADETYIAEYTAPVVLPSSGKWSELALKFEFRNRINGYAVVLADMRVG